jgi:hypothetical protein
MSSTKLTINKNGSIKIEGDFEIVDAQECIWFRRENRFRSVPLRFIGK